MVKAIAVLLSWALLGALNAVPAQPATHVPRIGIVADPPHDPNLRLQALRDGLRDLGYVEGRTVLLEVRRWDGISGHSPSLVADLIRIPVDVLVVPTTGATMAARQATATIAIVAAASGALEEAGAGASLARPGGNVTGLTAVQTDLSAKRLALLKEAVPGLSRVAVLMSPYRELPAVGKRYLRETEAAARTIGLELEVIRVEGAGDLEAAFRPASQHRARAAIVLPNQFWDANAARVGRLALEHRLPLMAQDPGMLEAGALMRYGVHLPDLWRRAASYVDRILKGAKPADLPVEQPTRFLLTVNLRTARALRLTIPPSVLARADEVIE